MAVLCIWVKPKSYIQALTSVTPFTERIIQRIANDEELASSSSEKLTDEIGNLVRDIRTGEYRYITPHRLNEAVKQTSNGRFANGRQEDGHELLVYMMDEMHEETKDEEEGSVIERTFRGKMETKFACTRCKGERITYQKFDNLVLRCSSNNLVSNYQLLSQPLSFGITQLFCTHFYAEIQRLLLIRRL